MRLSRSSALLVGMAGITLATPLHAQSLDATIAAAMATSPQLAAAQAREDAADAAVSQAQAEHMPTATAQGQYGWGRIDPKGFFGLTADDVSPRSAQVGVDLPLFTGGRIGAAVAQAKGGREFAQQAKRAAELQLRLDVVQAYSQALTAQQQVLSYGKTRDALEEVLRQSKLMFKAGAATSTDVAQAEARKAEAEAGLAGAQGNLASALARLERLAGKPVTPSDDLPPPPPVPASEQAAVEMAVANSPQLAQARAGATIAQAAVRGAKAEQLPTVGAYAEAATVRDQFFPGYKADSASVGFRARWNFFAGGRIGSKIEKTEAEARAAEADARAAEQLVEIHAVQSFAAVNAARLMVDATEKSAAATQEALRSTRLEVKSGAKPQLALLDAEREALTASMARIQAKGNLLVAAYTLRSVTGMDD